MSPINVEFADACPPETDWLELRDTIQPQQQFATRSWFTAWASAYVPMDRWVRPVKWLIARDSQGRSLAHISLGNQRWPGLTVCSLGGYYWPFRVLPITSDEATSMAVCSAIASFACSDRSSGPVRLGPVPQADLMVNRFVRAFADQQWFILEKRIGETLAVRMPGSFEALEQQLGSHLLKKVAYFERRLRKLGDIEIRQVTSTSRSEWRGHLDDLAVLEGNSWVAKEQHGTTKFLGDRNRRFWEEVASSDSISEALRVWIMYFRGIPVSYSLNIDSGNTRYILANGYDDRYKEHSTGMVLAYHVLRDASERGIETVEWGLGDSGYKSRWHATRHHDLVDLILVPRTIRGMLQKTFLEKLGHYVPRADIP